MNNNRSKTPPRSEAEPGGTELSGETNLPPTAGKLPEGQDFCPVRDEEFGIYHMDTFAGNARNENGSVNYEVSLHKCSKCHRIKEIRPFLL